MDASNAAFLEHRVIQDEELVLEWYVPARLAKTSHPKP